MYIGFRWNESILPPPIVDWSPKLTAGSRSSNLKSPWDGEINTRPHGAHANDQSLCSLPATQRLHVPTLDMSGIPLCSSRGFTTTTQGTHWSGGWLRLGTDGNRFFDSYFTLLHCGFNGNKMKQIYFMISVYSLYIIYISIYLSICHMSNTFEARAKSHPSERKVPKKWGILHELLVHSQWISGSPLLHRTNSLSSICNHVVLDSETFQVEKPKVF
jgi:hypothetical protein